MTTNRTLYVVAMNHAVNDGSVYLLSSLFPVVLGLFTLSVFQVGILVGVGYFVSVIFQPIIGRYGEGRDSGRLLAIGILLIAVSTISFIFSTGFLTLLASVVLLRIGSSFFHPIGISAVSRTYAGPGLQRAMGFQSSFGNLGVLFIFLTAATVYTFTGWQVTFAIFAVVALVDVLVTVTALHGPSGSSPGISHNLNVPDGQNEDTRIPVYFLGIAFVSGGSYAVILNFANIFIQHHQLELSISQTDLIVSAFVLAAALGALSTGSWTRHLQTGTSLGLSYLLSSAAIMVFSLIPANLFFSTMSLLACGFTISATYPLTYTALSQHILGSPRRAGPSFGALSSAQTVGATVMGLTTGLIVSLIGESSPFILVGIIMLLACLATFLWKRHPVSPVPVPLETIPIIDPTQS